MTRKYDTRLYLHIACKWYVSKIKDCVLAPPQFPTYVAQFDHRVPGSLSAAKIATSARSLHALFPLPKVVGL